jgi:hypothetical protein
MKVHYGEKDFRLATVYGNIGTVYKDLGNL